MTLINAAAHFSERPRLHEVATGNPPRLRPIAQMLEGTTVQFCQGYATKLDAERQKIHLQTTNSEEQIPYDYLVMRWVARLIGIVCLVCVTMLTPWTLTVL